MPRCLPLTLLLLAAGGSLAPAADAWQMDVVHRKRGLPLRGLVIEQGADAVRIRCISRRPGSPTVVFLEIVPRAEVARLELRTPEERKALEARLEAIKRERELLAARLRALDPGGKGASSSDEAVDLQSAPWPADAKIKAWSYQSVHFRLLANTRPELARLAAIHLEQVYDAFARALPPRHPEATPTTILLTRSLADYQVLARNRGLTLSNPAFYDPARNQVACGSDLERLCDELEQVRSHHARLRAAIVERRGELTRVYRGKVPGELLAALTEAETRITAGERRNNEAFTEVRQRLFQRLTHEAFHAYVGTFVYTGKEGTLPLWLNEGLAQVFETAIVEAGELRVGHADPERLATVRRAIARGNLLGISELLRAGHRDFQAAHSGEQLVSDRHYLSAWALAFYLRFGRQLSGGSAVDAYVAALQRGTDPLLAFRDLVGQPLPAVQEAFLRYLSRLRPDGSSP